MKHKLITLSLLLSLLTAAFSGCSDSADTGETSADTASASEVTSSEVLPIPEGDFGGSTLKVFLWEESLLPVTEEDGDTINDAIYRRNSLVEETYNIDFDFTVQKGGADFATWISTLNSSILAGDNAVHLSGGYGHRLASATLDGGWTNLLEVDELDFDAEWWPSNIQEAANLGGAMYMATGNVEPEFYGENFAVFFNKQMALDYSVGDLYALVKDGKWTLDKLIEYAELVSEDIDGDSQMTEADKYGFATERTMGIDSFLTSCDVKITEHDENGVPRLLVLTDKYSTLHSIVNGFVRENKSVFYDIATKGDSRNMFSEGRVLFFSGKMEDALKLRAMDADFGIIPYPKYDEKQESYHTFNAIGNATNYIIPVTADASMVGTVLEALAYFGWRDVMPEYYEVALKTKSARDNESAEMLDIIFSSVTYDFTNIYAGAFDQQSSPSLLLRTTIYSNKELASTWASFAELHESTMEKLVDSLK